MQTGIALIIVECLLLCWLRHGTAQQQGDIRLMNGPVSSSYVGRLEIYDSSAEKWGTICIEGFTIYSANTACKQLGRARAESYGLAQMMGYGTGSGTISLTQVQCGDDDNHILRCSVMGVSTITSTCDVTQDVGITCSNEPAFQYEGGVRLVDGQYSSDGILEVFIFNMWYTLCTDELPSEAANTVCTQLGYTHSDEADIRSGVNTTSVWRTSPDCTFSTSCFSRCYTRPTTVNDIEDNCPSSTYVHITCGFDSRLIEQNPAGRTPVCYLGPAFGDTTLRDGDLRLQGGNQYSGRLEIYDRTRGRWGTICIERFTLESANTVCRQLGYSMALQYGEADHLGYGRGNGLISFTDVVCDVTDHHILRCDLRAYTTLVSSCTHEEDVAIVCENRPALEYEGSVRLVDGPYRSEGRLEVFIYDGWYSPCTTEFNDVAANTVCTQLGYTNSIGFNIIVQDVATTPWEIPAVTCNPSIPCFSICYERPVDMSTLREMQSCPSFTYVYVRCDFDQSNILTPSGDISQCYLGEFPTDPTEPTEPPPTPPGTIVGITIGVTAAVIIILLFILHSNGTLKRWKQRWDKFVNDTRVRLRQLNPRTRVHHRPTSSTNTTAADNFRRSSSSLSIEEAAHTPPTAIATPATATPARANPEPTSDTDAKTTHDDSRPPDYQEAVAYRKPGIPEDEGYPEPSLVDGPQPPSYDSVY